MRILVDIGGTNTRITACTDGDSFAEPIIYDTPREYEEAIATLTERARAFAGGAINDDVCLLLMRRCGDSS